MVGGLIKKVICYIMVECFICDTYIYIYRYLVISYDEEVA